MNECFDTIQHKEGVVQISKYFVNEVLNVLTSRLWEHIFNALLHVNKMQKSTDIFYQAVKQCQWTYLSSIFTNFWLICSWNLNFEKIIFYCISNSQFGISRYCLIVVCPSVCFRSVDRYWSQKINTEIVFEYHGYCQSICSAHSMSPRA